MAAGLFVLSGVEMAHEWTAPMARGWNVKSGVRSSDLITDCTFFTFIRFNKLFLSSILKLNTTVPKRSPRVPNVFRTFAGCVLSCEETKFYSKWLCEKDIIKLRSILGDCNRIMCHFLVYIVIICINITLRQLPVSKTTKIIRKKHDFTLVISVLLLADACGRCILHTSNNHVDSLFNSDNMT